MDPRSEKNLSLVHPELAAVIRAAAKAVPFIVIQGVRSPAQEALNCQHGTSETMHSRHFVQSCGYACAVDVAALDAHGQPTFAPGQEETVFGKIAEAVKAAAKAENIPIQWGGDPVGAWTPGVVSHFRDWGHFQLPWKEFP